MRQNAVQTEKRGITCASHHLPTKHKRTMRAGRRRARRPHGSGFCCASNKKSPRGPRAFSDRRPSNRPRAQTPQAASAGRLNHKLPACQSAYRTRGWGGVWGGEPEVAPLPNNHTRRPSADPRNPCLHRASVRASPPRIGLPSSHPSARLMPPSGIGARPGFLLDRGRIGGKSRKKPQNFLNLA